MLSFLNKLFNKNTSRDEVIQKVDPFDKENLDSYFAEHFTQKGGIFYYAETESEGIGALQKILDLLSPDHIYCNQKPLEDILNTLKYDYQFHSTENCDTCFIECEALVALDGSIMISSDNIGNLKIPDIPGNIIVWAYTNQLVSNKSRALEHIKRVKKEKIPSNITSLNPKKSQDFLTKDYLKEIYLLLIEQKDDKSD